MGRFSIGNLKRGISYFKRNGLKPAIYKALERLERDKTEEEYAAKIFRIDENEEVLNAQRLMEFPVEYKISILIPAYETDEDLLRQTLESVAMQTYGNWELCIADASKTDVRHQVIKDFCEKWYMTCNDRFGSIYDKVKYQHLSDNLGISGNTNEALAMATGDYIALLDHDDLVDPRALCEFMKVVSGKNKKVLLVYTDEDKISQDNSRYFDFHIKPDFDPVLLCTNNYICHLTFVDRLHAKSVGGFYSDYDGAQDHDFILRCAENVDRSQIVHIPMILYHWRSTAASTAENPNAKLYAYEAGKKAVSDHLKRMGIEAVVTNTMHLGFFDIDYKKLDEEVKVYKKNEYDELSEEQLYKLPQEYILIVAKDLVSSNADNVSRMLSCMNNGNVGAVTGKIIGNNGRIESAGYDRLSNGEIIARFNGLNRNYSGYMHRAAIAQSLEAFTEDLVLLRKSAVASFKKDIVLKEGYLIYYEPKAEYKRKHI